MKIEVEYIDDYQELKRFGDKFYPNEQLVKCGNRIFNKDEIKEILRA